MNPFSQRGVTVLAIVIAIATLTGVIALAVGTGTFLSTQSTERQRQGKILFTAVESGVRDALLRIARNRDFECRQGACTAIPEIPSGLDCDVGEGVNTGYDIDGILQSTLGGALVCVKVTKTNVTCPGPGHQASILSVGTQGNLKQKIKALISVDCNGQITVQEQS